jgi:pimeloyl-ACP methyl ester carboxylesterase
MLSPMLCLAARPPAPATLQVGGLILKRCEAPARWCGTLPRPLDPSGRVPGTLPIYFEFYPHTAAGPAVGTLVPAVGGPGSPTTDSRDDYLALYAPLRSTRDVLMMDYRGTGRSGALDCPQLQQAPGLTEADIGSCGTFLGQSARFYSTTAASDDLAALLDALGVRRIDLYADSSGTFFAQTFAVRHAQRVRSLVLDGAFPLKGADLAWWPNYAPAMRAKFDRACSRDPACAALPGDSLQHIVPALARLRQHPLAAAARYGSGATFKFTADASALASVMFSGWPPTTSLRETDAAARAFVADDQTPLLRLMAETLTGTDSRDPTRSPALFSAGMAAVVFCLDEPQIFAMGLPPAARRSQRDALIARRRQERPEAYAPFTIDEYRAMPLDYAFLDQCVAWPAAPEAPLVVGPAHFPDIPVLVVSGDLDNMTDVNDGAETAAQFPRAHHLIIENGLHINALPRGRGECAAAVVRRYIADLEPGKENCPAAPPLRLVPLFARTTAEVPAARALPNNHAGAAQLRAINAALLTCADLLSRVADFGAYDGVGLRGGTFAAVAAGAGYRLTLHEVRWTEDLAVSGHIDWPGRTGRAHALLALKGLAASGTLEASWLEGQGAAQAQVRGTLNGSAVAAEAPAP